MIECDIALSEGIMNRDKLKGVTAIDLTAIDWHIMTSPSHGFISHQAMPGPGGTVGHRGIPVTGLEI